MAKRGKKKGAPCFQGKATLPRPPPLLPAVKRYQELGPFVAFIWRQEEVKGIFQNSLCHWQEPCFSFNTHGFSYLLLWGQHDRSCCVIAVYTSCHKEPRFPGYPSSCWSSSPSSSASPLSWTYRVLLPVSWNCFAIALGPMVSDQQNLLYPQQSLNNPFIFFLLQTGSHAGAWFSL